MACESERNTRQQHLGFASSQLMKTPGGAKNNPEIGSWQQQRLLLTQAWQDKNNHSQVNVLSTSAQNLYCKEEKKTGIKGLNSPAKILLGKSLQGKVWTTAFLIKPKPSVRAS